METGIEELRSGWQSEGILGVHGGSVEEELGAHLPVGGIRCQALGNKVQVCMFYSSKTILQKPECSVGGPPGTPRP